MESGLVDRSQHETARNNTRAQPNLPAVSCITVGHNSFACVLLSMGSLNLPWVHSCSSRSSSRDGLLLLLLLTRAVRCRGCGSTLRSSSVVFNFIDGPDCPFDILNPHEAFVQGEIVADSILFFRNGRENNIDQARLFKKRYKTAVKRKVMSKLKPKALFLYQKHSVHSSMMGSDWLVALELPQDWLLAEYSWLVEKIPKIESQNGLVLDISI